MLKTRRKQRLEIVYGHGTFGLHEIFPNGEYLTFVREPVSHTVSNYHYIRSRPHNRLYKIVRRMSFKEFVANLKKLNHENLHYRQLTNSLFRVENPDFYGREILPDYELLEYALKKIDHIYRFEEINSAIQKIAAENKWRCSELPHLNISRKDAFSVDEQDIETIRKINFLDDYIYQRAERLHPLQAECSGS